MSDINQGTMLPTRLDKYGLPLPSAQLGGSNLPPELFPAALRKRGAILDQYGKPYTRPETTEVAPATLGGWRYYMANTIADLLTPARLVSLLREAEQGNILRQMELFEAMEERDARLSGLLTQRKAGVTGCGFALDPGDDSPQALRARDFCAALLPSPDGKRLGRIQSWSDRLRDLLDAVSKGFSCLEILWETSERQWLPADLKFRPQRWWTLDLVDRQKLLLRDVSAPLGLPVNPFNFVMHRHNAHSGSLQRGGISLACARPFLVRNYALRDWLQLAELCGVPIRLGELPPGATQEDADLMWRALTSLGSAAAGMVPSGGKITFAAAPAGGDGAMFDQLRERAGEEMSLAVLGQIFTGGGGEGHALGYSGEAHETVRFDLVNSDARALDETLNRQFFGPVTLLNFGPDAPPPVYRTLVEEPVDLQRLATSVSTLVSVGLRVPANWARRKFGIPAPAEGEEVLTAPAVRAAGQPADSLETADDGDGNYGSNGRNGNYGNAVSQERAAHGARLNSHAVRAAGQPADSLETADDGDGNYGRNGRNGNYGNAVSQERAAHGARLNSHAVRAAGQPADSLETADDGDGNYGRNGSHGRNGNGSYGNGGGGNGGGGNGGGGNGGGGNGGGGNGGNGIDGMAVSHSSHDSHNSHDSRSARAQAANPQSGD